MVELCPLIVFWLREQLESMNPIAAKETGDAPEHTERFNRPSRLGLTHIGCFPPELGENPGHSLLGSVVVAANEHSGGSALELRIHHARAADRIERLHESCALKLPLETFHQGFVEIGEEFQYSVHGRGVRNRVGRVDDDLASQVGNTRSKKCVPRRSAFYGQHNQFREFRSFIEAANATPRVLSPPLRKFLRGASAYHYGMIMLQKTSSESFSNITRSQDSDFHVSVSPCNGFRRPTYNLWKIESSESEGGSIGLASSILYS